MTNPLADVEAAIATARASREQLTAALTQAKELRARCDETIALIEAEINGKRKIGRPRGKRKKPEAATE